MASRDVEARDLCEFTLKKRIYYLHHVILLLSEPSKIAFSFICVQQLTSLR
jgi:hypothetical protein